VTNDSLRVSRVWGKSIEDAVLSCYSESAWEKGEEQSILVRKLGDEVRRSREKSCLIEAGWVSASGAVYCVRNGDLLVNVEDGWRESPLPPAAEGIEDMLGFSHADGHDELVLVNYDHLFHRGTKGDWTTHEIPKEHFESPNRLAGRSARELYIVGGPQPDSETPTGILRWDGSFHRVDSPYDEFFGVAVTPEGVLYVAGEQLYRWSEEGGWHELPGEESSYTSGLSMFAGHIYAATTRGVYRVVDNTTTERVHELDSNGLSVLGDMMLVMGSEGEAALFRQGEWTDIDLQSLLHER
jgi:hypothetical protein